MLLNQDHLNEQHLGIYCSASFDLKPRHMMATYNQCLNSGTSGWAVEFGESNKCTEKRCKNGGACIDGSDTYTCLCAGGFTGQHCESKCNIFLLNI